MSKVHPNDDPTKFYVMAEACEQCLFTKDRVVSGSRAAEIIRQCNDHDTHFECHKGSLVGRNICCRGFYDSQKNTSVIRLSEVLQNVVFVGKP